MKILLTGGLGYIGSHAAVAFTEAGHEVVLYDNLYNSRREVALRIETVVGRSLPLIVGDVRDTEQMTQALKTYHIEVVIHFAGLKSVGESLECPIDYYSNNVSGTISLLQAMEAAEVHSLVFSSSAAVYGEPQYLPVDEDHPTQPTTPYGHTKLNIESVLRDISMSDSRWRVVCLRYFNPVGAHESGLIGEESHGLPSNLMPYIAGVAAGRIPQLAIHGEDYPTPDGSGVRDFIHVMDLAEGHLAAMTYLDQADGWDVFNLGTGRGISVKEMVAAYEAASGRSVPCTIGPRRSGDVASCYAEAEKAARVLGWRAERSINDMCADTWKWEQSRRD